MSTATTAGAGQMTGTKELNTSSGGLSSQFRELMKSQRSERGQTEELNTVVHAIIEHADTQLDVNSNDLVEQDSVRQEVAELSEAEDQRVHLVKAIQALDEDESNGTRSLHDKLEGDLKNVTELEETVGIHLLNTTGLRTED